MKKTKAKTKVSSKAKKTNPNPRKYRLQNEDRIGIYEHDGFLNEEPKKVRYDPNHEKNLDLSEVSSGPFTLGGKPEMRGHLKTTFTKEASGRQPSQKKMPT
jgi:hypothetical protein